MAADTGAAATIGFATTSTTGWLVRNLDLGEETINDIDTSHLGTTNYMTYLRGDLAEPGETTGTLVADPEIDFPTLGANAGEDMTITFPISDPVTNSTPATFVASGYLKRWKRMALANDELQLIEFTFKHDGDSTEPTFTKEAI